MKSTTETNTKTTNKTFFKGCLLGLGLFLLALIGFVAFVLIQFDVLSKIEIN
jgi:hypothetical protein